MPDADAVRESIDQLQQHLRWRREEGLRRVEVDPALLARLGSSASAAPRAPAPAAPAPRPVAPPPAPKPAPAVAAAPAAAPAPAGSPAAALKEIADRVAACRKCGLCSTRTQAVPGQGHPQPAIMFIGEGPGRDEDQQGLAFVGRAGQLLTRMIIAMGLTRDDVFIGNIVKCRPTEGGLGVKDRPPTREEMDACLPYLHEQIAALRPKVIVALGGSAVKGLFGDDMTGITRLRGTWLSYRGTDVMPTFHPSYLLRQGGEDKESYWLVWQDLAKALERAGLPVPDRKRRAE